MSDTPDPGALPAAFAAQLDDLRRAFAETTAPLAEVARTASDALDPVAELIARNLRTVEEAAACLTATLDVAARHPGAFHALADDLATVMAAMREEADQAIADFRTFMELVADEAAGELDPDDLAELTTALSANGLALLHAAPTGRRDTTRPGPRKPRALPLARRVFLRALRAVAVSPCGAQPHAVTTRRYCRRSPLAARRSDDPSPTTRPGALVGNSTPGRDDQERRNEAPT